MMSGTLQAVHANLARASFRAAVPNGAGSELETGEVFLDLIRHEIPSGHAPRSGFDVPAGGSWKRRERSVRRYGRQ